MCLGEVQSLGAFKSCTCLPSRGRRVGGGQWEGSTLSFIKDCPLPGRLIRRDAIARGIRLFCTAKPQLALHVELGNIWGGSLSDLHPKGATVFLTFRNTLS